MAIGIIIILYIAALFVPRSRSLYWAMIIYMWLLFSFNTGAPDTSTYEWIYTANIPGAFEPIFTAIMWICRTVGLPFVGFRMVVATLILCFLNLTYNQIKGYKTLATAIYMIAPFPWQVSGMRAALACVIVMYAMTMLLDDSKDNTRKYCILILVATLVHYSSVLFFVMLLSKKGRTRKQLIIFIAIAVVGTLIVQHSDILFRVISQFTNREKIITWLSGGIDKEGYPNMTGFMAELFILAGNIILTQKAKSLIKKHDAIGTKTRMAEVICSINVISILFVPLLRLNDTYIRLLLIIHGINIVLYITATCVLDEHTEEDIQPVLFAGLKSRFTLYGLIIPLWTYIIAFYQNLPYFGTAQSVLDFLEKNSMFN